MSGIPALDRLGADLAGALRRELPGVRRRQRALAVGGLLALAVAVPAAGTATDWAGLAGGETPLPTQVRPDLRVTLAEGRDARGGWRMEVYRAALAGAGGAVGICVFASRRDAGSGRCVSEDALGRLTVASDDGTGPSGLAGGVVRGTVARVEVALRSFEAPRRIEVVAVTPAAAPGGALEALGLPTDLRPFAILFTRHVSEAIGFRALDDGGTTVAVVGMPAEPAPAVPAHPSPFTAPEVRP